MGKRTILLLLFAWFEAFAGQPPRFIEEFIQLSFDKGFLSVSGTYLIQNGDQGQIRILYPYPPGGPVDSLVASDLTGTNLSISEHKEGFAYTTKGNPLDTNLYLLGYRQKCGYDSATYIVKTTKSWGRPLQTSHIIFSAPAQLKIKGWSFQPDSCKVKNNTRQCEWTWKNFWPDFDWKVYFE